MSYSNIDKPSKYFDTKLYTGNGSTQSITGVGFQPDWVWIKNRSAVTAPVVYDAVRGATKDLYTSATDAEGTNANGVTSFNSDGFSVGSSGGVNGNTQNIASWNWKANGAGVSNTQGSITSTVSANTTSGFSIVSYTGNGTSGATIGHGLGVAPKMLIVKNRNTTNGWEVYHASLGATKVILLNSTEAEQTSSSSWNNTAPTSTVFSVGTATGVNGNTNNIIAYCFAEVKGYSKAFSYTGNGSTDGSFVYCGFRPAWILIKKSDGAVQNWVMHDSKRSPFNLSQNKLFANLSDAEDTGGTNYNLDILSNGFKLRSSNSDVNSSGGAYIGFAVAENPFVSSKGVPVCAR